MARFDGKVAIVTGAASGIGKEIALRFAAEGAIPVIADLNLDAAEATAAEIRAKGSDAFAVAMNVTDEAQVDKGVAEVVARVHDQVGLQLRERRQPVLLTVLPRSHVRVGDMKHAQRSRSGRECRG